MQGARSAFQLIVKGLQTNAYKRVEASGFRGHAPPGKGFINFANFMFLGEFRHLEWVRPCRKSKVLWKKKHLTTKIPPVRSLCYHISS